MYKATFEIGGWGIPQTYEFQGNTLMQIVDKLQRVQSLDCLVQMGRMQGIAEDLEPLDRLDEFLGKYYSGRLETVDFEKLDLKLSIGNIRCVEIAEN